MILFFHSLFLIGLFIVIPRFLSVFVNQPDDTLSCVVILGCSLV